VKNTTVVSKKSRAPIPLPMRRPRTAKASVQEREAAPGNDLDLHHLIRTEAYFRSERRGFAPGAELHDWFEAERHVKGLLACDKTDTSDLH
jgi:hypothetical protein